ncbi:hypothetical protein [Croceimicrobium sp.]|uniref:hypothetical protein n=1 Tax=Croceimicrobium sp. TaxID=2828340 RepID=UPI003BAAB96B
MKVFFGIALVLLGIQKARAHDPDRAFFTIYFESTAIRMEAEVPWTFRKAVSQAFPEAMLSKDSLLIAEAFELYLRNSIQLFDQENQVLNLLKWRTLPAEGHQHSGHFELLFEKGKMARLENHCMLELYEDQENQHFIPQWDLSFNTNRQMPNYQFDADQYSSLLNSWLFVALAFAFSLILGLQIRRRMLNR